MGILSRFIKKKEPTPLPELPKAEVKPEIKPEDTTIANVKAKMDLILTQMDSLRAQYATLTTKIEKMEKILDELYKMAQS